MSIEETLSYIGTVRLGNIDMFVVKYDKIEAHEISKCSM